MNDYKRHPSGMSWERWHSPFKTTAERRQVTQYFRAQDLMQKRSRIEEILETVGPALIAIVSIVVILWAVSVPAHAQTLSMKNEGGGEIVITGRPCRINGASEPDLRQAYAYNSVGKSSNGCWAVIDNMVHIVWETSRGVERRIYSAMDFSVKTDPTGVLK